MGLQKPDRRNFGNNFSTRFPKAKNNKTMYKHCALVSKFIFYRILG